ncbi:MAG: hypothetical protein FJ116_11805 [Deltaproteobacteria bacterium]|nr:hypothetical protein [Deltaproteobacteria bacterium]
MKIVLFTLLCLPLASFAGKAEREYFKNEVQPAVAKAETAFNKACGCALKISVAESDEKHMYQYKHIAESVQNESAGYCTDDASKKAVCKMKSLEINKGTKTEFTFAGGKGKAITDGQSYVDLNMMTAELDK